MASDDPTKLEALDKMSTIDYLILLDKKMGDLIKKKP